VEVHIMASTVYFVSLRAENEHSTVLGRLKTCARKLLEGRLSLGDLVAVKLHFGERGNHGFIRPVFVRAVVEVVRELGGKPFLTDTNTLYTGFRHNAFDHLETALFHGFGYPAVPAPLVIADGLRGKDHREVEVNLKHFRKVTIASAIQEADFLLVMTHVKGHIEAGLGGAIKNVGMGCASRVGKQMQHGGLSSQESERRSASGVGGASSTALREPSSSMSTGRPGYGRSSVSGVPSVSFSAPPGPSMRHSRQKANSSRNGWWSTPLGP
jgi:uncharacterized Fe-S center protein